MTAEKELQLEKIIAESGKIAIAFSGGVDSSFLLEKTASISKHKVIAISLLTPFTPLREKNEIELFKQNKNIQHEIIRIETMDETILANKTDRCYRCKLALFKHIQQRAIEHQCNSIFEGSNASDMDDYRPGMKAIAELKIKSPLLESGFTKNEIRMLLKNNKNKIWDKPANSCLATRIPTDSIINTKKLSQIDDAEEYIYNMGFKHFRVRHHDNIARIEIDKNEFNKLSPKLFDSLNTHIKGIGFTYVTLDMGGYKMGSANK